MEVLSVGRGGKCVSREESTGHSRRESSIYGAEKLRSFRERMGASRTCM